MSYCRFSTDDYQCDLYVYDSDQGVEVSVASVRYQYQEPLPEDVPMEDFPVWIERYKKVMAMVECAERVPIGLPHDGGYFTFDSHEDAADFVEKLGALGYQFPPELPEWLRENDCPPSPTPDRTE